MRRVARITIVREAVRLGAMLSLPVGGVIARAISEAVGYVYNRTWAVRRITYYDHRYDHLRGSANWFWVERGVFGARWIDRNAKVLDVGCGDGLFDAEFFSPRAALIDALDRDEDVIRVARKRYSRPNIRWFVLDAAVDPFPGARYDAIFMFAVIEHFSVEAGSIVLQKVGASLSAGGHLLGSTPLFDTFGNHNLEHDNEFFSTYYLREFLKPHFSNVEIWTSDWRQRIEGYFLCSGPIQLTDSALRASTKALETAHHKWVRESRTVGT